MHLRWALGGVLLSAAFAISACGDDTVALSPDGGGPDATTTDGAAGYDAGGPTGDDGGGGDDGGCTPYDASGLDDAAVSAGSALVTALKCRKCHGDQGRGDGPSAPTLKDDAGHPMFAADLHQNWRFNGGGTVEDIYHRLRTGLDGTPMPSFSDLLEQKFLSDEQLWRAYIQLTQAEAAFRIQKDELRLRPIWHQRADRVLAHILVCFLAFVLWKSLEMWQQRAGLGNSPRTVLAELARIQSHDVVLPTATHGEIRLRCVTQPDAAQVALLDRLGIVLPKRMRTTDVALALTA